MKKIYLLMFFFLVSCATYKLPIQTKDHPASTNTKTSSIELSPILDINKENKVVVDVDANY